MSLHTSQIFPSHERSLLVKAVGLRSSDATEVRSMSESTSAMGAATDIWEKRSIAPKAAEQRMDWRHRG
jgi:hypothetical protein